MQAKRVRASQKETEMYYSVRRNELLANLDYAIRSRDAGNRKDALDAITKYNREVPYPTLKIGAEDKRRSLEARGRTRARTAAGLPVTERYVPMYRDIAAGFPRQ